MDNRALLWAKPDMAGILLKRGGQIKSWKKRQFILKDSYLFYFKVLASVVCDLERRWAAARERDAYREAGKGVPPLQSQGGEDPVILQALADALIEAYHTRELLQNRIKEAHTRSEEASSHLTVLERAASMQEEVIMAREDLGYLMSDIQAEMTACSESLEWLIPARFEYYNIERQVEALEGLCECGEGVPSATELEAILQETLRKLEAMEFQQRGDEELPDEKVIAGLGAQLASIYVEYMAILQHASESVQASHALSSQANKNP